MLLHAQPIFVADFDPTISPFVVIGTFGWIKQGFFGILFQENEKKFKKKFKKYIQIIQIY